ADREASIFYALALNMTLNPNDKTYANQLKAAGILEKAFAAEPNHPGVAHYLIHSYDFPPIADKGLPAARRYASIAPAAPHALHMPSHIFTRVGAWQDSIDTNRNSARAALEALRAALTLAKNNYWAEQSEIQRLAVAGWIARAQNRNEEAVNLLRQAADREAATEKHPVTPGALFPSREMLGDLLLDLGRASEAL